MMPIHGGLSFIVDTMLSVEVPVPSLLPLLPCIAVRHEADDAGEG